MFDNNNSYYYLCFLCILTLVIRNIRIIEHSIRMRRIPNFLFTLICIAFKAKLESDRLIVSVGKKAPQETFIKVKNHCSSLSLAHRREFQQLLQGLSGEGPLRLGDLSFKEFAGFQIALLNKVAVEPPEE